MKDKTKDPFLVKLGERIRTLRKAVGLTQERLAEKADVSVNFIGNAERGETAASVKTLRRIAKALEVDLQGLFDFPDEVHVSQTDEIVDEILSLLKSKDWDLQHLTVVRNLLRIFDQM